MHKNARNVCRSAGGPSKGVRGSERTASKQTSCFAKYKQRWLYWRSKAQTTGNSDDTGSDSDDEHNLALRRLKEEIAELEEMNTQLNDEIKELTTMSKQVETIEGGMHRLVSPQCRHQTHKSYY